MFIIQNREMLGNAFKTLWKLIKSGKAITLYYQENKKPKTRNQCSFLFGGLIPVLQAYFLELHGFHYDSIALNRWLYKHCSPRHVLKTPDNRYFRAYKTLSEMSLNEATEYISNIINFIETEYPDCVLTPSLRMTWLLHITDEEIRHAKELKLPDECQTFLSSQKTLTCVHCGIYGCEAHHLRINRKGGTATKPPDWLSIPLCGKCHDLAHKIGQKEILKHIYLYKFEPELFCKLNFIRWYYKNERKEK